MTWLKSILYESNDNLVLCAEKETLKHGSRGTTGSDGVRTG